MDLMDYRRKIIANSPHIMSASGAVATFSDGDDLPLKSLNVNVEPVQSGSGDPSPDNVRPISGWNGVKVTRCGKNLFSLDTLNVNAVTDFTINPIPPGTYVFSAVITSTDTDGTKSTIVFKDANGASLVSKAMTRGDRQYTTAFTVNSPITKITCYAGGGYPSSQGDTAIFSECMITAGSTATPYEPYNGVTVTIDLGQTVYGGTLNVLTGVLTVDRTMVDLGTLTWNTSSSGTNRFYSSNNGTPIYDKNNGVGTICSQYKYDGFGYPATTSYYGASGTLRLLGSSNSQTREIYIVDDAKAGKTGAQFKADMSGVQLVYKLATPYEIQLTPHQVRSLYGNNTIYADTGNVALEYWAHP